MFDGERLRRLLADRDISQSELARRVGISQASVFRLVKGDAYGSKHLHRIARELRTTPAYLTGETDDPDQDVPAEPELSHLERALIDGVRHLSPSDLSALLHIVGVMAGRKPADVLPNAPQMVLPPEAALARMFEGLLMAMDPALPRDEQALLLARRLPIGLSQLRDLLPVEETAGDAKPPSSQSNPVPVSQ